MLFGETFVEKDLPILDKCKAINLNAVVLQVRR